MSVHCCSNFFRATAVVAIDIRVLMFYTSDVILLIGALLKVFKHSRLKSTILNTLG